VHTFYLLLVDKVFSAIYILYSVARTWINYSYSV